ncbi:hypothetical protein Poly30_50270 [Planctomycetes bacterium Poly30]|uniref:Uncharacterized protein n=1 Tax=Saltatorellus ferox TaxID=2528018 RepID=A0A518EZG5_9BACT|nr:hypothetical protein Poly30_50270 [Planctomycetes bacterium Poly30]
MDRIPAGMMDGFNAEHPFKGSRVWRAARLVLGVLSFLITLFVMERLSASRETAVVPIAASEASPAFAEVVQEGPLVEVSVAQRLPDGETLPPPGETEAEAAPFDPSDLVPVHAVLLDRWTKEPLGNAPCFVTDSRDVMVPGTTDEEGVLRTKGLLLRGPVTLRYADRQAQFHLEQGVSAEDLAKGVSVDDTHFFYPREVKLQRIRKVPHSGDPASADAWNISVKCFVALELRGIEWMSKDGMEATLASADGTLEPAVAVTPARFVFDEPDWLKNSTLSHLAIEIERTHSRAESNDWAKAGIRQEVPGRKVRLIRFEEHRLLLAETEVATVPLWDEAAIPCVFQEFVETDPDTVRSLFARQTAEKILTWQRRKFRSEEMAKLQLGAIGGALSSRTGHYHGRVRVIARPVQLLTDTSVPYPSGTAQVAWTEGAGGRWSGRFEIPGLAPTRYRLSFKLEGDVSLEADPIEAFAPHDFGAGELVVADDLGPR